MLNVSGSRLTDADVLGEGHKAGDCFKRLRKLVTPIGLVARIHIQTRCMAEMNFLGSVYTI